MTALVKERMSHSEVWGYHLFPLAVTKKAYKGGIAVVNQATGKVEPGSAAADLFVIGKFAETVDATAAEKPVNVELTREVRVEWFANSGSSALAATDITKLCYLEDDQTVAAAGASQAGRVWAVDAARGVAVEILSVAPALDAPAGP